MNLIFLRRCFYYGTGGHADFCVAVGKCGAEGLGHRWQIVEKVEKNPGGTTDRLAALSGEPIHRPKEFSFVNAFQYTKTKEERDLLITYFKESAFKTIVKVVQCVYVAKEIEKFLVLLDDFVVEDMSRIERFNEEVEEPWKAFIHLLHCSNNFVRNIASRIITKLMVGQKIKRPSSRQTEFFLEWLKIEMNEENKYLLSVARCLQRLLQVDDYRLSFMNLSGIVQIINLLNTGIKPQAQYQFCFCLWVTTFNSQLAAELEDSGIIPILVDVMERCPSEVTKLPRVVCGIFRNLLEKPKDLQIRRNNALMMIQCKMLQCLDFLETRRDLTKDPEFVENFEIIRDILNACVTEFSCFDEYFIELKSGRLRWSVVHTSKRFWMENAEHLNENKYDLLKILIDFLQNSNDVTMLCIAAHDIGEYIKHYPRGKLIVDRLGGKDALVRLLSHRHPAIKFHALKTLQVLMLGHHQLVPDTETVSQRLSRDTKIGFGL